MKLSAETINVLENFSKLNSGIQFKEGNVIKSISTGKTVLAKAVLKDTFPQDFCVYDLNQFLMVYKLNKDTDVDFDDSNIIFKSGRSEIKYRKTASDMIILPPEKDLNLPSTDITFTLSQEDYAAILKTASVLQSPNISVQSDGDDVNLVAFDAKNDSAHKNSIRVGDGNGTKYKMTFSTENWKMIPDTYTVQISSKGLSHFVNKSGDIQYWIAIDSKTSKYGE